jgi:hypothetical protein
MNARMKKFILRVYDQRWVIFWAILLLIFVGVFVFGLLGYMYYITFVDPSFGPVPY